MHFHEISSNPTDWQFRLAKRVLLDLRRVQRSWYARMIHVSEESLGEWSLLSVNAKYDALIATLAFRFAPCAYASSLRIVISDRSRSVTNHFLPSGLQDMLNRMSQEERGPEFSLVLKPHKSDDLLQLADLLTSAVRQCYYPSENRNKLLLAGLVQPFIGERIRICEWEK